MENLLFISKSKQKRKYFYLKSVIFLNKNHISNDFDIPFSTLIKQRDHINYCNTLMNTFLCNKINFSIVGHPIHHISDTKKWQNIKSMQKSTAKITLWAASYRLYFLWKSYTYIGVIKCPKFTIGLFLTFLKQFFKNLIFQWFSYVIYIKKHSITVESCSISCIWLATILFI